MQICILPDSGTAARHAAAMIAARAQAAVGQRGRFLLALSGGRSPWDMLRCLTATPLPWPHLHVRQVDDRQVPAGHPQRNLTHLTRLLVTAGPLPVQNLHPMPVDLPDLDQAAAQYAATLHALAGQPPVVDLIHLGLGADGHTASLLPGDPVLEMETLDVAATGSYQGHRRLTLTFPLINRARFILWLVIGADKAQALARLLAGDPAQPAGRIRRHNALVVADEAAASLLPPTARD